MAIPSQDDYVWKVSSEKVPHLTLLYLGQHSGGPEVAHIAEFIEHAAETSLHRFGLSVDRRGELGADNADVIFFDDYFIRELKDFRSYLLKDNTIKKFYESAEQYPSWTPHLTLGYPEAPAKPDERDYPGISYVRFDRLALWTGNFEGPEFLLKDQYADMAMSDVKTKKQSAVEKALAHYGIKGMRWGVRRSRAEIDAARSEEAKKVADIRAKAKKTKVSSLSNSELQAAITRMNLEQQYSRLASKKKTLGEKFVDDMKDAANQKVTSLAKEAMVNQIESALKTAGKHKR